MRGPTDRIRLAELTLDSDQSPDVDLLVTAARDAIALTNVTLGERLARAAVNRGGGLVASELLARSLLWQGNAAEAEETLSAFDPNQMNELELVRWGLVRIANLHWSMGDAEGADEVLDLLCDKVTHPGLKLVVAGVASASRLFENQLDEAVELSERVLADPERIGRRRRMGGVRWRAGAGADGPRRRGRGRRSSAGTRSTTRSTGCCAISPRSAKFARWCSAATSTPPQSDPRTSSGSPRRASTWRGAWPTFWSAPSTSAVAASPTPCPAWSRPSRR